MDRETWNAARALFERVAALDRAAREQALGELDAADPARVEVERLLASEDTGDRFLEAPAAPRPPAARPLHAALPDLVAAGIPYRIERVLASGGMATVYEATQDEPRRRVALKVLRSGLGSDTSRRRFRWEAELLARLHHPCIAQVYDAGVVPGDTDGLETPWFALEFVEDAQTITAFARARGLALHERIRLFLPVLAAVQHGHQRGVVHRDLKPANVLVDAEGRVKVIDFGVARTLGEAAGTEHALTREGELVGTLRYMSPEQLSGRPDDVDARSDVYALGVLLHELLCDAPPFDLAGRSVAEVARIVCEEEPTPPSARRPDLPVDLDWVVARAMAREPALRYASVSDVIADLERFLRREPVVAGPPSRTYVLRKFVTRHRAAVTASALVLFTLVLGLVGTGLGLRSALIAKAEAGAAETEARRAAAEARAAEADARRAETEARAERREALDQAAQSEAMLGFLLDALEAPAPRQAGRDVTMVRFLEDASGRIDAAFADRPRLRGFMNLVVGRAFYGLGEPAEADAHLAAAAKALRAARPAVPRELADALADRSVVLREAGRLDEAAGVLAEARTVLAAADVPDMDPSALLLRAKEVQLAVAREDAGVESDLRALLADVERELGADHRALYSVHHDLARVLHGAGRLEEAGRHYRAALDGWLAARGPEHPEARRARGDLIVLLYARGETEAATAELEELVRANRETLGDAHPDTVSTVNNLASIYYMQGRYADAAPLFREALAALEEQVPEGHPMLSLVRSNLGTIEVTLGHPDAAEPHLRAVYDERLARLGPSHDDTLRILYELGRVETARGRHDDALAIYARGLRAVAAAHGERHPRYARFELEHARTLVDLGRTAEARTALEAAREAFRAGERSSEIVTPAQVDELLRDVESR